MNRRILLAVIIAGLVTATTASTTALSRLTLQTPDAVGATTLPATIPFEMPNRHIIMKVSVNNSRPLNFVLDTGAKFAIINIDRATELGLSLHGRVRMGGAGAETPMGAYVRDTTFTVPGLSGFSQPVTLALPIGPIAMRMGQDFDGILGGDFIGQFVVEVDYKANVLRLHDKEKFTYSGRGESIPIKLSRHGHPTIEAEVKPIDSEAVTGKFILDIGAASALALHSPFVNERQLLTPKLKTIKAIGMGGAGGESVGRIGRVESLKIGNYTIVSPITVFSQDKDGAMASSELMGNIGAQVANRFRLFLDYGRSRIIFEPNDTFGTPYDRAYAGISLRGEGKDYSIFRITDVLEESPASEVGLQKGDIITAVDGKVAGSGVALSTLNKMLEKPTTYKLTIRRGEQTLQVTLKPRKLV